MFGVGTRGQGSLRSLQRSPRTRTRPLTLTLSPHAGRGNQIRRASRRSVHPDLARWHRTLGTRTLALARWHRAPWTPWHRDTPCIEPRKGSERDDPRSISAIVLRAAGTQQGGEIRSTRGRLPGRAACRARRVCRARRRARSGRRASVRGAGRPGADSKRASCRDRPWRWPASDPRPAGRRRVRRRRTARRRRCPLTAEVRRRRGAAVRARPRPSASRGKLGMRRAALRRARGGAPSSPAAARGRRAAGA